MRDPYLYDDVNVLKNLADIKDSELLRKAEADTLFYRAETAHSQTLNDAALNGYGLLMGENRACWPTITARPYEGPLSLCGMEVEVLSTPGHSRGSVCLYLRDEGVLFSGDTLFQAGYGRLDLYGGDMNAMIASLKALFALPGNVRVYPGHGGETTIGAEKARYRL